MFDNILQGIQNVCQIKHIFLVLIGTTFGMIMGAMPGLTATMAVALLVPFTYTMGPAAGLIALGAIYMGAIYGGAFSAILINTPGTPSSIGTTFDGYPMAKQGRGEQAVIGELRLPKAGTVEIVPSILSADFARLADEIAQVKAAGVKMVHLDVMDGHFVPNITIGPPVIAKLRKHSDLVFDSHLMISEPEEYAERFVEARVNNLTFHIEVAKKPERLIEKLHEWGCTAGITLNPGTPTESIKDVAPLCDMVLVMTVEPGFGGQSFMQDAARKVIKVREMVGPDIRVEVDGGIDAETTPIVVGYGADTLVAGNAIFGKSDRAAAIEAMRAAARQ